MRRHGVITRDPTPNYMAGCFTLVDHCPPPGDIMRIIVERGIAGTDGKPAFTSPEIRPWSFLGGFENVDGLRNQDGILARTCPTCAEDFRLWATPILEQSGKMPVWLSGQCQTCERVYWMVQDFRVIEWINAQPKPDPNVTFCGVPVVYVDDLSKPPPFNPNMPLCQKPCLDVKGRKKFEHEYARAIRTKSLKDQAPKAPTFAL